jgi:hypothetical protein
VTDEVRTKLSTLTAPYGRQIRLEDVRYESGMRLLRVVIREGHRITDFEIDAATATEWARVMQTWAEEPGTS